jgi:diketogulonate reductase-like aldo/keto reductase
VKKMEKRKLSNGLEMPAVGLGTWLTPDDDTAVEAVKTAVDAGYRLIDGAAKYENEKSVGKGIRECGVPREELFVTSKVWNTERGYDKTMASFDKTLSDLGLDYLDLYLIHWPASENQFEDWRAINADTWRALEDLYKSGRVKAIGVSNFKAHHLKALIADSEIKPMVDQIEFHPGFMQYETLEFCRDNDILVEAWSPLGRRKMLGDERIVSLGKKYGKSPAQICIRWCIQNGVTPLPKSVTPERIRENIDVFDFRISAEDMKYVNSFEYFGGSGLDPDEIDF